MDGLELAECVAAFPELPVILISGNVTGGDLEDALRARNVKVVFLGKPFTASGLRQAIATAIRGNAAVG